MSQLLNGSTLFVAVLLVSFILFAIAYFMKPKSQANHSTRHTNKSYTKNSLPNKFGLQRKSKKSANNLQNPQLIKLKKLINKNFPEYKAIVREHHLILERNAKKIAMLTIDKKVALGRRHLGEITVINFHHFPTLEALRIELSGV